MMEQTETRGWRDSVWNRSRQERLRPMGRSTLALGGTGLARGERSGGTKRPEIEDGSTPGFMGVSRMAPVRHRYDTGNRWLIRVLEWVTAKTWPLAVLDEMCEWFEEGSGASRIFVGGAAAVVMAALLSVHWAALYGLQALTLLPVFGGHGVAALVAASFLAGVTILPAVLGQVLGVLLRFYVLLNLCSMAAVVGYGGWLLYSYAKF